MKNKMNAPKRMSYLFNNFLELKFLFYCVGNGLKNIQVSNTHKLPTTGCNVLISNLSSHSLLNK